MPTLAHLLEELGSLKIKPDKIRIRGEVYDQIVADAEESGEEEED